MNKPQPPFLLDGATGTNLYAAGMPKDVCVESWVLQNPQALIELQRQYAEAGSMAVTAPTFGASRPLLGRYGLAEKTREMNLALAALSRRAVGNGALVAGNLSPTGLFIEPFGETGFDGLCGFYAEQAGALREAGVDYIAAETFYSLADARAALLAAKKTGLPVTVTFTADENGRTLSGADPAACLTVLAAMGADAVGLNCSAGPETVLKNLSGLSEKVGAPLIAKPNAGLPRDGVYDVSPDVFAGFATRFYAEGAGILGGCCGTTPAHIRALREETARLSFRPAKPPARAYLADERRLYEVPAYDPALLTLSCGDGLEDALYDLDQEAQAYLPLRVRSADEAKNLGLCCHLMRRPVCILADTEDALREAALLYQGRALVDPRSGAEKEAIGNILKETGHLLLEL